MSETEEGKKINTRQCSMNLVPGYTPSNEIKIGSRVPVEGKQGDVQYIDVGTTIFFWLTERGDALQLEVKANLSNFANPDQESQHAMRPVLRQLQINASTVAMPEKPTVVGVSAIPIPSGNFNLR